VGVIADPLDGSNEVVDRDSAGVEADRRLFRREVHGGLDAVEVVQPALDSRRAGRTGHPVEGEVDALGLDRGHGTAIIPLPGI
jgi:hypothetical protein